MGKVKVASKKMENTTLLDISSFSSQSSKKVWCALVFVAGRLFRRQSILLCPWPWPWSPVLLVVITHHRGMNMVMVMMMWMWLEAVARGGSGGGGGGGGILGGAGGVEGGGVQRHIG